MRRNNPPKFDRWLKPLDGPTAPPRFTPRRKGDTGYPLGAAHLPTKQRTKDEPTREQPTNNPEGETDR